MVKLAVVGRLGFRDGVSASYSYFRRVGNFDISHTAAVWLSPALIKRVRVTCYDSVVPACADDFELSSAARPRAACFAP